MKFLISGFFVLFCSISSAETYQCKDMKYEMKEKQAKSFFPALVIEKTELIRSCTYINGVKLEPDNDTRSDQGPLFIYTGIYDTCSMNGILMFDPEKSRVIVMSSKTLKSEVLNCKKIAK